MTNKKQYSPLKMTVNIAGLFEIHLNDLNYDMEWAKDGGAGLNKFRQKKYDLVI